MKKTVNVSQLASYCANKDQFIQLKGRAANAKAAIAGTKAHNSIGKSNKGLYLVLVIIVGGIWSYFMYYS